MHPLLMELPETLLDQPAGEAARLIVLRLLADVAIARLRVGQPNDPEALHDFRVALRRLRSAVRAWRPWLGNTVAKRTRRRLRALARATGRSRDLEVHLEWVRTRAEGLREYQRPGAAWLLARMERSKGRADQRLTRRLNRDFARIEGRLRAGLFSPRVTVIPPLPAPRGETGGVVLGRLVDDLSGQLATRLAAVRSIADQVEAHQARIAGKRLRYVLEPVAARVEGAPALILRLKALQDGLGRLHDAHVFAGFLARALQAAAVEQTRRASRELLAWAAPEASFRDPTPGDDDPRLGLIALAHRLHEEAEVAYREVRGSWLDAGAAPLLAEVNALAYRLSRGVETPAEAMVSPQA